MKKRPTLTGHDWCPEIIAARVTCMIESCDLMATGHVNVTSGPAAGRRIAVTCLHHGSEAGWEEFANQLYAWQDAGLLSPLGDRGPKGKPSVWHIDHWCPLDDWPDKRDAGQR